MQKQRGIGLAGVLIVLMMCSVLVGTTLLHFRVAQHGESELLAQGVAEQVVGTAVDRINKDAHFGLPGKVGYQQPLKAQPAWAGPEGGGKLIFGASGEFSTNNLYESTAARGWNGTVVPPHSLHLVGVGKVADTRRVIEVQYQNNPFPYAIGSNSPLKSQGDLLVGSLHEGKIHTLQDPPPDDQLKPGHLRSNSAQQKAVQLSDRTLITGNVESAGGIDLDKDTRVLGASRPFCALPEQPAANCRPCCKGSPVSRARARLRKKRAWASVARVPDKPGRRLAQTSREPRKRAPSRPTISHNQGEPKMPERPSTNLLNQGKPVSPRAGRSFPKSQGGNTATAIMHSPTRNMG